MITLESNLTQLKGVGPNMAKKLARLGLRTVGDLLNHLPVRYEDFSHFATINNLKVNERVTIKGKVQLINTRRSWKRRLTITEALIKDDTGSIKAVWFNQPYLAQTIKPGAEVMLAGTLSAGSYGLQLEHPTIEPMERSGLHTGRLVPIYPATAELSQRCLRNIINQVLPLAHTLDDPLPKEILAQVRLPRLSQAIYTLHSPSNQNELITARRRVTFDELFFIHLKSLLVRLKTKQQPGQAIPYYEATKELVAALPWQLTPDQRQASWEIIKDLGKNQPMYRLLQGDVGSGKTVVAGIAAFNCLQAGGQVAFLAPTEILAEQHFHTLSQLFKPWPITIALLTHNHRLISSGATVTAASIKQSLASGQINLVVGTHALLQSSVNFYKLALVVIDEQHRFGVAHRQTLMAKRQPVPHLLSMTATPIPRSLALTIYGDLDISLLKNLPPGRLPIVTKIVKPHERPSAYALMRQAVAKGNRVFIICPLIAESESLNVRAATAEQQRLQREVFPEIKLGLLHGKLSAAEKTVVMKDFKNGRTPILVCTSVIEVGVDVPEATVMAIEGAERFGLAQLHQLRGRVGRSSRPSYCLLLTDNPSPRSLERLGALTKFMSGFELAETDLAQRGPGDILGEAQSGFLKLRFAELADAELLKLVREIGSTIIQTDPELKKWPKLAHLVKQTDFHPE